jgi:predicted transposase/invertase (TIGR01784 family)
MTTLTPKNDIMFKMIFGDQNHTNIFVHFLSSVIKPKFPIKSVKIMSPEPPVECIGERGARLDIVATTDNKEIINIEIQRRDEGNMKSMALYLLV